MRSEDHAADLNNVSILGKGDDATLLGLTCSRCGAAGFLSIHYDSVGVVWQADIQCPKAARKAA